MEMQENDVARLLSDNHEEGELGIIGRSMVGQGGVVRLPSEIYWNGLRTLGLVLVVAY